MEIRRDKSKGAGKDETEDKFDTLHIMRAYRTIKLQIHLS